MGTVAPPQVHRKIPLTATEREVVLTYNDTEKIWHVYSDSATLRGTILRLARQLGADVRRVGGHGIEFEAPADALRLTAKRKHAGRASNLTRPRLDRAAEGKMTILDGPLAGA